MSIKRAALGGSFCAKCTISDKETGDITVYKGKLVAHTGYNNDDNKYPKNHIKVKVSATAAVVAYGTTVTHTIASFHNRF